MSGIIVSSQLTEQKSKRGGLGVLDRARRDREVASEMPGRCVIVQESRLAKGSVGEGGGRGDFKAKQRKA